eukprot:TRINITY_DN8404_c2_g1_i1.p1 TRINITY_DN8404_c2_g1~~TRINITY_DN8404_c2_g1_i1.p1  ORF type:complete len:416 (+),score=207.30 TRINITY_DN8404_c2_g1_i1:48-1250(+)
MPTVEELQQQIAALQADRDAWKAKVEGILSTPATQFPKKGRSWLNSKVDYPQYDTATPKESFVKLQSFLLEDILKECKEGYEMPPAEVEWTRRMLNYNTVGGKMNRGLMVVESGVAIFKSRGIEIDNDAVCRFAVLGWCIEFLQAWLLMLDDIMDDSTTRRGQPCWYRNEDVKLIAINDALMVECLTFKLLKRHFGSDPAYPQLLDLFVETTFQTEVGQLLDTLCMNLGLTDFTTERWELIVKYKTSFYSFYMAVASGMILSGITDVQEYDRAREILVIMGVYFQAQDDYLDCYGTPEQIGKIGTDIQDKKCGWLFVHAFNNLASPEQKEFFRKHYGKCACGSSEEQKIKNIYSDLGLPSLYERYEAESYERIMSLKGGESQVPWVVFEIFLNKIYKRTK